MNLIDKFLYLVRVVYKNRHDVVQVKSKLLSVHTTYSILEQVEIKRHRK